MGSKHRKIQNIKIKNGHSEMNPLSWEENNDDK